ncbi:efflux RND transporter periplasmic adaptor subunit [Ochrobactrum sp. Marseille-Q0166]|nr:efflux RND transporter periplasmic adaptor subunit [Ochrobactrum sp. Marseille-Q0166]
MWIGLAVVAVALGAGWYLLNNKDAGSQKNTYLAETVQRGNIEDSITAVGTLSALRSINVGAQVSGQLKSVKVEIGDEVKQGDLIAEIDPSPFEKKLEIASAQLDNLRAQLLNKQAQLNLKKSNATRQRSLLATRAVSQSTIDQADADLAMAEADVKALSAQVRQQEAQLASDKVDLGYTKIYSPMVGTVVDQTTKEGETLNAVQSAPTVVTVADLKVMTVEAQVSEADISKLKPGMPVYFTLLGQPDKRFAGTLRQIKPTPQTDNNVVLYYALFDVPNPTGELMINMSAQVYFVLANAENVLTVPVAALNTKTDNSGKPQTTVQVVDKNGATTERVVDVGVRNRVQAEVKSGLEEGDKVVVTSASATAGSSQRGRRPGGMFF